MLKETLKKILIVITILAGSGLAILLLIVAIRKAAESPPYKRGPSVYLRDVYVLADQTLSLDEEERETIKDSVKRKILNHLGPGDRIIGYRVGSNFVERVDLVIPYDLFGDPPKVPDNLAGVPVEDLPVDLKSELSNHWKEMASVRQKWRGSIDGMRPADGKFSDYAGTLKHAEDGIKDIPHTAVERWLIIIGDLKHEEPAAALRDHIASKTEKQLFVGVKVYLLYPGGKHEPEEQAMIESDWRKYFKDRGNKDIQIISFGHFGHFPHSAVPRPEERRLSSE